MDFDHHVLCSTLVTGSKQWVEPRASGCQDHSLLHCELSTTSQAGVTQLETARNKALCRQEPLRPAKCGWQPKVWLSVSCQSSAGQQLRGNTPTATATKELCI